MCTLKESVRLFHVKCNFFYDKILSFIWADKQNSAYLPFCNIARIFFRVKSGLVKDRIFYTIQM